MYDTLQKPVGLTQDYCALVRSITRAVILSAEKRNPRGYFGKYGGQYVPEVLYTPLQELSEAFFMLKDDEVFWKEYALTLLHYVGRPTPLYYAKGITNYIRSQLTQNPTGKNKTYGANVFIKLEGFAHTGAHKINNAIGQVLLAKKLGKTRIIAETGAGQHGLATATACAKFGMDCVIYMGVLDVKRQRPNVHTMEMLGAKVIAIESGQQTLKDAINEAMRDWAQSFSTTHYVIGSALGPAPFPEMVQCFQSVIGAEIVYQCEQQNILPEMLVACVGGGSNAIGSFTPFVLDKHIENITEIVTNKKYQPQLHIAEAGGRSLNIGEHASRLGHELDGFSGVKDAIIHGYKSKFLVNDDGQVERTHSISAGLDYPGIGPIFAYLADEKKVTYCSVADDRVLQAVKLFAKYDGIVFALESAHAAAATLDKAGTLTSDKNIIIIMSGRGDKDLFITAPQYNKKQWVHFLKNELKGLD